MEFRDKPMENLIRLQEKDICKNINALLLEGEQIVGAYKTVRDQVVFTSHRIIMVDMQGVTGTRQQLFGVTVSTPIQTQYCVCYFTAFYCVRRIPHQCIIILNRKRI